MGAFLSPVDPLFYAHHANIDRLWDVWTRRMNAVDPSQKLPVGPWQTEPFLFFTDASGKPASKTAAGDYAQIGDFDYDYQPGSGEDAVPSGPAAAAVTTMQEFSMAMMPRTIESPQAAHAASSLPGVISRALAAGRPLSIYAQISVQAPADTRGLQYHVFVNPPSGKRSIDFHDASYAGTFSVFGGHVRKPGVPAHDISFLMSITAAVKKLRSAKRLKPDEPLQVYVFAAVPGVAMTPMEPVKLSSVKISVL